MHEMEDESQVSEKSNENVSNRIEAEKDVEVESMEDDEQRKAMQQYLGDMSIAA